MSTCQKHPFERSVSDCRVCHWGYCADCLVYPHGPSRPPYCVACAVAAAGVRTRAGMAPRPKRAGSRRGLFRHQPVTGSAAADGRDTDDNDDDVAGGEPITPAAYHHSLPAVVPFASLSREPATMVLQPVP